MNPFRSSLFNRRQLRCMTWLLGTLWTLVVAASAAWNAWLMREGMFQAAAQDALNSFNKDMLYRQWATLHGGVYVPVTAFTPPNPYLTNVVERDIVTPSGRRLTLINPEYMARQVHELETQEFGTHGHITSLKPLRPENAPDAWEAAALRAFEQGRTEVISRELLHGQSHLRLMKPLVTEATCLKCHAEQGYHEGDVRGGISIAVPLDPYRAAAQARTWPIVGAHAGLWALGTLGILLGRRQMRQRLDEQLQSEEALRASENRFRSLFDSSRDAVMTLEPPSWKFTSGNPATVAMFGAGNEARFVTIGPWDLSPERQPDGRASAEKAREMIETAMREGSHSFEWTHRRINGEAFPATVLLSRMEAAGKVFLQATCRDITEQKQMEAKRDQLIGELKAATAQVKTLSGLLPICSGCKKIRDDKGHWSQVEKYIQRHSEATFTHGLCPDCIKKYFPGLSNAE